MRYIEGKLGADLTLDFVYIDHETLNQDCFRLRPGDRFEIRRRRKWVGAVLRRDMGGWLIDTEGGTQKIRDFTGKLARFGFASQKERI